MLRETAKFRTGNEILDLQESCRRESQCLKRRKSRKGRTARSVDELEGNERAVLWVEPDSGAGYHICNGSFGSQPARNFSAAAASRSGSAAGTHFD